MPHLKEMLYPSYLSSREILGVNTSLMEPVSDSKAVLCVDIHLDIEGWIDWLLFYVLGMPLLDDQCMIVMLRVGLYCANHR